MARVTFTADYSHPIDALSHALYRSGRSYTVTADIAEAASHAGAIKENTRGRSGPRARKGGADASEG